MVEHLFCSAFPAAVFVAGFVIAHFWQVRYGAALMLGGVAGVAFAAYQLRGFDLAADAQAGIGLVFIAIVAAQISGGIAACGVVIAAILPKGRRLMGGKRAR